MSDRKLGMNLSDLLGCDYDSLVNNDKISERNIVKISIDEIYANPKQPRKTFVDSSIKELSESIKNNGLIQPITVIYEDGKYKIVSGERRYRATKLAGLSEIECIVQELDEKQVIINSIIENIQREDLNPVEEALSYEVLIKKYDLTHDDVAKMVSKSRPHITNLLRVLSLPKEIVDRIAKSELTMGHAKVILTLDSEEEMIAMSDRMVNEKMSVKKLDEEIKKTKNIENEKKILFKQKPEKESLNAFDILKEIYSKAGDDEKQKDFFKKNKIQDQLDEVSKLASQTSAFNIKIEAKDTMNGFIEIKYESPDELQGILERLCIKI